MLAALHADTDSWRTFNELRSDCNVSASTLHSELVRLREAGIIERDASARPHRFRFDMSSPVASPLSDLIGRTIGVETSIRHALEPIDRIEAAAIFGSWARGEAGPASDIDVLIVGDCGLEAAADAVRPVELSAGRDINLIVVSSSELDELRTNPLLIGIERAPLIDLIGDLGSTLSRG